MPILYKRKEDIAFAETDVIVNAANGIGCMGGQQSVQALCSGVAEHLNYYTNGELEAEAKRAARHGDRLFGYPSGEIYKTNGCGLKCHEVYHAVMMFLPGMRSSYTAVKRCLDVIYSDLEEAMYHSVAVPMLGCGTGRLNPEKVLTIIVEAGQLHDQIETLIYLGNYIPKQNM